MRVVFKAAQELKAASDDLLTKSRLGSIVKPREAIGEIWSAPHKVRPMFEQRRRSSIGGSDARSIMGQGERAAASKFRSGIASCLSG